MNTYHYSLPPVVDLPNNPVVSPPYVAPPAVSVKPEVEMNFTPINARSVDIVVEAPASRPLSSYDYNPVRTEYNPLPVTATVGITGSYIAPKSISVEPMLNLGGNIAAVENQTYADVGAIPFNQDNIVGLQPNITYAGNAPVFALVGQEAQFWSEFPAVQSVNMAGYGLTGTGNVTMADGGRLYNVAELNLANGDIRGCSYLQIDAQILTADAQDLLLNGVPIATINNLPSLDQWAEYPAIQNVVMNAEGISGQPYGITGSKFYGFSNGSTLGVTGSGATANLLFNGSAIGGTGTGPSQWANYPAIANVNMSGKEVSNINKITFNTAVPGLGGASINALNDLNFSYATALVGQANVTNVNNIAFWNPNSPGVPGFYVNLYSKNLTYNGLGNVYLASDTKLAVPSIYLGGVGGLAGGKLEVLGANAQTATVNNRPCSASWSQYPCSEVSLDMNHNQIISCRQIDFAHANGGPFNLLSIDADGDLTTGGNKLLGSRFWATLDAVQDIDAAQHNLVNVPTITFANPANSLTTNGQNQLVYNGQVIQTGNGNIANWAQYNANHDVVIPSAYALSINAENTLNVYRTSVLNTNIAHGVAGNNSSPNFTSYPTDFTVNSARKISFNTTNITPLVSGIGLNSASSINIDCATVLTIAAVGDVNVAGAITTFEIGEFNIACANWNVEAAALEWATGAVVWGCGAFDLTATGTCLINAPLINLAGASVSFTGGLVTIASGGLAVAAGGVSVAGGGVSITGGGLLVGGAVANLNGGANVLGTLTAGTIAGVSTLAGAGAGAVLTNIQSITGADTGGVLNNITQIRGSGINGLNLTGVKSINGYSVAEVIFSPETYTLGYTAVTVGGTNGLLRSFPAIDWPFNSPKTNVSVTVNGSVDVGVATAIGISISFVWAGGSTQTIACDPSRPALAPVLTLGGSKYTCSFNDELATQPPYNTPVTMQINALATGSITTGGTIVVSIFPSQ
jgi:hypothetical protein